METLLHEFLQGVPGGASAAEVASQVFALEATPQALAVVRRALGAMDGVTRRGDAYFLGMPEEQGTGERFVAVAGIATSGSPQTGELLELALVPIEGGEIGEPRSWALRPVRSMSSGALESLGIDPMHLARGESLQRVFPSIQNTVRGATLVCFRSQSVALFLHELGAGMARAECVPPRGSPPEVERPLRLSHALRAAGLARPGDGLYEAAASLGLLQREEHGSRTRAMCLAEVLVCALERGISLEPPPPVGFDFERTSFGPELLASIPTRPGIYRFYSRSGALLYVGKSKNLCQRVASYFATPEDGRRRFKELMGRVWRVEWEETGSELEALLAEQEAIRVDSPELNTQREVRRTERCPGRFVLLVPGVEEGIRLLFIVDGRVLDTADSDRRCRGMRPIRRGIRRALESTGYGEAEALDERSRIVSTWLVQALGRNPHVDLGAVRGINEAAGLVKSYLRDKALFEELTLQVAPGTAIPRGSRRDGPERHRTAARSG